MFGSNEKTKTAATDYNFDLEVDLQDPAKLRATKEQIEDRVQKLKAMLREGGDKKTFDQTQTLLHGYLAVLKVIQRVNRKSF